MSDGGILERRRIEAEILGEVYKVLKKRSGKEEAQAVIGAACSASAIAQGKAFAESFDHAPDLADLAAILPNWTKGGALEMDVLDEAPDRLNFNVTRCRYSEMYAEMGLGEIGHLLSCNRDGDFCIGFNPDMELQRSQTIMQGASHCDFRYRMKEKGDE
jgi:hypothetical protein